MTLKDYLQQNNIPVKRFAEELSLSRQHVYDMLNGDSYPSRKLAIKIESWSQGELTKEGLLFGDKAAV